MNNENLAKIAEQRSNIYGFLSLVYLHEPTNEFVKSLKEPNIRKLLNGSRNLQVALTQAKACDYHDELVLEYTRLFIGPGKHISPYESVWCDEEGLLFGKTTSEVKKSIESLGLKYRSDWTGFPDHIGVELEFMQKLTNEESDAWERDDKQTALRCLEVEKKFVDEHLIQWIPMFCDKVVKESNTLTGTGNSFYGQIAQLTKKFIEFDKKQINEYNI